MALGSPGSSQSCGRLCDQLQAPRRLQASSDSTSVDEPVYDTILERRASSQAEVLHTRTGSAEQGSAAGRHQLLKGKASKGPP